ncbi:tyrosine recombinase XerC [soil metagenome]
MVRTAVMPSILDLAPSFARSLRAQNRSPKTVTTYGEAVNGLAAFLESAGMPTEVSKIRREHVEAYTEHLLGRWKPTTAANRYKSLRVFFRWLVDEGEIPESPMAKMRPPSLGEPRTRVLSDDELRALLKTCAGPSFDDRRDLAIIMVFIDAGARLAELVNLRVDDVRLDDGLLLVTGKGARARDLPIGSKAVRALDRYGRVRRLHPFGSSEWYWLGKRGRMNLSGVQQMLRRRASQAGIGRIHPHMFRHGFAHSYLAAGGSETNLMKLTGWQDRTMLQRYAASTASERASAGGAPKVESRRPALDQRGLAEDPSQRLGPVGWPCPASAPPPVPLRLHDSEVADPYRPTPRIVCPQREDRPR